MNRRDILKATGASMIAGQLPVQSATMAAAGNWDRAKLGQDAALHVAGVEIAAGSQSLDYELTSSLALSGAAQTVIDGMPVIYGLPMARSSFTTS